MKFATIWKYRRRIWMIHFYVQVLVLIVSVRLGASFNANRSDGGCIDKTTHRSDIFPYMKVPDIKCKQGCHGIVEEVQYAVLMIERRVVGCRKTKNLLNGGPRKSPHSKQLVIGCNNGFTAKKVNITILKEESDRLVATQKEIIIDCVQEQWIFLSIAKKICLYGDRLLLYYGV